MGRHEDYMNYILTCPCKECILRPICLQTDGIGLTNRNVKECCFYMIWMSIFLKKYRDNYIYCPCPTCIAVRFLELEKNFPEGLSI